MQDWSGPEDKILQNCWGVDSKELILAKLPERTWSSIQHRAFRLGLSRRVIDKAWTDREVSVLIKEYGRSVGKDKLLSALPGRSWQAIKNKASLLDLKKIDTTYVPINSGKVVKGDFSVLEGETFRFGIVSDTHFGSKYSQITWLHSFYKILEDRGIKTCFHAGDLSDGNGTHYLGQLHEMHIVGADNLRNFIVDHYPRFKDGKTYAISGWHDLDLYVKEGYDLLENVAKEREDFIYLGQNDATFELGGRKIYLLHPAGGTAYALSYHIQKLVEGFDSGEKPHIAIVGHYHRSEFIPFLRNVCCFQAGNFQWKTPFAIRKKLAWQYGGWLVEMLVSKKTGIISIKTEFIPFYVPIDRDYLNYPER